MHGPVRTRQFSRERFLVPALMVSLLGNQVFYLALPWLTYNLDGTAAAQGLQYAGLYLPFLVLPLIGMWADRVPRRRLLLMSDLVRIGLLVTAAVVGVPLLLLVALAAGLSFFDQVFDVSLEAALPDLVGDTIGQVNVRLSTASATVRVVGPLVGAWLLEWVGPRGALAFDGLTFLATLWAVSGVQRQEWTEPPPAPPESGAADWWHDVTFGLRVLIRHPVLSTLAIVYAVLGVGLQIGLTLQVFAYRHAFHLSAAEVGAIFGAAGAAALAGAAAGGWMQARWGRGRVIVVGIAAGGLGWLITALAPGWGWLVAGGVLVGAPEAPVAAATSTVLQTLMSSAHRGRVSAAFRWTAWALLPVASLGAGWMADRIGVRTAFGLSGSLMVAGALYGTIRLLPALRRIEAAPPHPETALSPPPGA